MTLRSALLAFLAAVLTVSVAGAGPVPRVIRVAMTSYKFDPKVITLRPGERVVMELVNDDPEQRPHNIASALFNETELTVRGEYRLGTTSDGRRFVFVDVGKKAEVEFTVPQLPAGEVPFICSVGQHAARGMTGTFEIQAGR